MFSCKCPPPALVTLLVLLTGCCVARGSSVPSPVNGIDGFPLLNNSLVPSPTPTSTGCMNLEGLLQSFGSINKQLNLTTMALDISGQVTYAFESTNRSLVRKVLSATRSDRDGGSGSEDWAILSPSFGNRSLLGVISLSRGVAPPASSINVTRLGASAAPALLATLAGSHCIFGVAIDAAQAVYSTSRYMGSCGRPNDLDGTFDNGTFDTPRYLVLTRSSTMLYVVEQQAIRALNYTSNRLSTLFRLSSSKGEAVMGAFLSPDEQMLFLPLRDGSILRVNVRRRIQVVPLLLPAIGVGGGSNFVAFAAAALGIGGQVSRVVAAAGTTAADASCPEDRYLLATRSNLAVAIAGTPSIANIPLNVTWSTNATVLCAAVHSDGRSLLVITSRNATDSGPDGIEYRLLTSSWARAVGRSPDSTTASLSTTAPVSASLEDTTVSSLPGTLSVTTVTDAEHVTFVAAATLAGSSAASQAHEGNRSSAAAAATAAAATAAESEPAATTLASTVAAVGRGSLVQSSSMDAYPAVAANDHVNVVLVSTISAGIACACLLAAGAYVLARRVRWSLLWKNRRLLVKLGPQGDDIILVPPGEYDPGSVTADGGFDCMVAVDCAKDPAVVPSVPQQQQQP